MIIELQRENPKFQLLGKIRIGHLVDTPGGKQRPAALDTFRFTSRSRGYLQQIADRWGGTVEPWGNDWEVITNTNEVPVIVAPQDPDNMTWYERWGASGRSRKCDGETDHQNKVPCQCNPEDRECQPVTRLAVMIPDIEGIGVWLLTSTGRSAATEMYTAIATIYNYMRRTGHLPPARLILEQREIRRPGEPTRQFAVPVLAVDLPAADVVEAPRIPSIPPTGALPPSPPPDPSADPGEAQAATEPVDHWINTVGQAELERDASLRATEINPALKSRLWDELLHLLETDEGMVGRKTIPDIKETVRDLYRLMETLGLYDEGTLELHWLSMLKSKGLARSHPVDVRLSDLGPKKDGHLVAFARLALKRAKERVSTTTDESSQ